MENAAQKEIKKNNGTVDRLDARGLFKIVSWLLLFFFTTLGQSSAGEFRVIRVFDGDTFMATGYDIEIKVRLLGIDAPEASKGPIHAGQPFSEEAKIRLAEWILNKTVEIKGYGFDAENHIIAMVYVNGRSINLEMVAAGLAEVCRSRSQGLDITALLRAEIDAQKSEKGVWSLGKYYISPEQWRKIYPR